MKDNQVLAVGELVGIDGSDSWHGNLVLAVPRGRTVSVTEMLFGQLFLVTGYAIGKIVSVWRARRLVGRDRGLRTRSGLVGWVSGALPAHVAMADDGGGRS